MGILSAHCLIVSCIFMYHIVSWLIKVDWPRYAWDGSAFCFKQCQMTSRSACHIVTRMSEIRNVDFPGILGWSGESVADCSCHVSLTTNCFPLSGPNFDYP